MAATTEISGKPDPTQYGYDQPRQIQYGYDQPQQTQQGSGQPAGYMAQSNNLNVVVAQPAVVQTIRPPDYLILSIVSCFFCWPMAICALVFSSNSRNSSDDGNYDKASTEGRMARNIATGAIIAGIIIIAITVILNATVLGVSYHECYGTGCD